MITVCIATVRPDSLADAVHAVLRQSHQDWELIVVAQGPEQATLRAVVGRVSRDDPRVRYVQLSRMGLSRARNAAIREAAGDVVAFTDDDCEPAPDWLETIAAAFDADPELGLVAGSVLAPQPTHRAWLTTCPEVIPGEIRYDPRLHPARPPGWNWIGANFALRRPVAEAVGPFDEQLGAGTSFPSGEDTDYKFRLEAHGVVMLTTPQSVVYHTHGQRSGVRATLGHSRNYARGNAAMAAKLTLLGNPLGSDWRRQAVRGTAEDLKRDLMPHRLPVAVRRRWHFSRAYRECLTDYALSDEGLLERRAAGG